MLHLKIAGTGAYLPEERIPNSFFEGKTLLTYNASGNVIKSSEVTDQSIFEVTGIRERRRSAPDEFPSDMGYKAAVQAIENAGISADSLVGVILATVTEDTNFPSGACKIQKKLGIRNCFAYDVANACAGFPEALAEANARVLRRHGNYLVIASECLTKMTDYSDINSTLFGDGAGAAVLVPTEDHLGILAEDSQSNPYDGGDRFIFRDLQRILRMPEGGNVLRRAVREMLETSKTLKESLGWTKADVYIPHQANGRIVHEVEARVAAEGAIVYKNIDRYGNMSAATCAVGLHECLEKKIIDVGSRVILVAFGGGLVRAGIALQF